MSRPPRKTDGRHSTALSGASRRAAPVTKAAAPAARATPTPAFAIPGVQRKLAVGTSDSPYEREADNVADSVVSGTPAPAITPLPASGLGAHAQRMETGEAEEKEETAQSKEKEDEPEESPAQMKAEDQVEDEGEEKGVQAKDADDATMEEEQEDVAQAKEEDEVPEEEPAQTMAEDQLEEEEAAQTKSTGSARDRDRRAATDAVRKPGAGRVMPCEVRRPIERATGANLSDVRVHDDGRAAEAAQGIGARAFTHGRDIWLGSGESARDTKLMAHEAAHVVQQTGRHGPPGRGAAGGPSTAIAGGGGAAPVQRTEGDEETGPPTGPETVSVSGHSAKLEPTNTNSTLDVKDLQLPSEANKQSVSTPLTAKRAQRTSAESRQRTIWKSQININASNIQVDENEGIQSTEDGPKRYFYKMSNRRSYLIGTPEQIAAQAKIPNWASDGRNEYFEVDHIQEVQLSGDASAMTNFQLLDRDTNGSSGNAIRDEIRAKITAATTALKAKAVTDGVHPTLQRQLDMGPGALKSTFKEVKFLAVAGTPLPLGRGRNNFWLKSNVENADHINALDQLTKSQANRQGLVGTSTRVVIMLGRGAVRPRTLRLPNGLSSLPTGRPNFASPDGLNITAVQGTTEGITGFTINPHGGAPRIDSTTTQATPNMLGGDPFTYSLIDLTSAVRNNVSLVGMSPLEVQESVIENDKLATRAVLKPTSRIFKRDLGIDMSIVGRRIELSKTFVGDDFDLPGPISITGSALTLTAGAGRGGASLSATGKLDFEVERAGTGFLEGKGQVGAESGFSVEGEFDFDPALFKGADAKINVGYANDTFTGSGTIKIGDDQIKGIKSAELNVTVTDDVWEATGTVEPKIPGVSQGTLAMTFDPNGGFMIAGELTLGTGIPRLKSGKLNAKLEKTGEDYKVSAGGEAELDIPGVAAKLVASYDDGKFKAEATAAYARGLASGSVTVGATNLPVDPETGQFSDGDPTETVTVYGAGSVTIRFTPWLQGTAGLKINPDGSMEVKGRVELPDSVEVFPEKKLEKELISVSADLPIVGVAVAGQRIGIFLNITGGLTAKASVGPGELKDVAVEVTYNPEDESSAHVTGSARCEVPAEAGLRLTIQGALGAGIPVVSARAGLELGAELGITALASAAAEVEWTPATGIKMEADIGISASPQFTFDITGFADVTADLLLTEIELYSKRWQLASFTYGSGMSVGANLKVKVENNEFKPISMDDVELTTPDIDPMALIRGVARQVF
ncbi:DUF4157 domain-containing protein [Sedimentitalea sp.]|uniref:DUF4157 domain-containing protein n=1 Tax=Sedimentitalea sp. TaxID=2048915 RepID=UPI0032985289